MGSQLWSLEVRDFVQGLIVAVLTGVLTIFVQMVNSGGSIDLKQIGIVALTSGAAYLLKKFSSDQNGKVLGKV